MYHRRLSLAGTTGFTNLLWDSNLTALGIACARSESGSQRSCGDTRQTTEGVAAHISPHCNALRWQIIAINLG
jgi:hypothetical protein